MPSDDRSIRTLLSDLASGVATLVRQELSLAQAEGSEKMSQVMLGLIAALGGLLVATAALLILLQALVIALSDFMPPAVASLIVGVALAIIAFVLIRQGQSNLSPSKLTPERTMRSLREDKEMVMEKAR